MNKALSPNLKWARKRLGMTQDQVAALSGVAQPIISRLESGKESNPSLDIARRLARVLGVSIDFLAESWDREEPSIAPAPAPKRARRRAKAAQR